jgi:AraC-like DNA-binding protein
MLNKRENISRLKIEDTLTFFEDEETVASGENQNQFLFIKSKGGTHTEQPHKSNFYSISITLTGSGAEIVNDYRIELSPGSLLFTAPGDVIASKEASSKLEIRQLLFKRAFLLNSNLPSNVLEELLWVDPDKPPLFHLNERTFSKTKQLFDKIAEEASLSKAFHRQILQNGIIELLYRINRLDKPCLKKSNDTSSQKGRLFEEFSDLVDKEFKEKKKVHDYAKQLHITPKHLSEVVKQESGLTALEYIHRRILREAKKLLIHTTDPAKKVAYDLGFNTPSQFGRFFKRETELSPIQFRKNRKTAH